MHDKLVWTLNFYVIETTSKFLLDCYLLGDSIISANNILKRTNDIGLFYLILNVSVMILFGPLTSNLSQQGLERLVILTPDNKMFREKIEKLSLDLMKMDNKLFSIGGLKLLVSCLYIGSLDQLDTTEKSNGIVQDEPEILMQSTEKIEILFTRIRTATGDEANIYGKVLGQILKDLLPPNEILTKVIKELLIMNQSNCVCIATIIHQVRTCIHKFEQIFYSSIHYRFSVPQSIHLISCFFRNGSFVRCKTSSRTPTTKNRFGSYQLFSFRQLQTRTCSNFFRFFSTKIWRMLNYIESFLLAPKTFMRNCRSSSKFHLNMLLRIE